MAVLPNARILLSSRGAPRDAYSGSEVDRFALLSVLLSQSSVVPAHLLPSRGQLEAAKLALASISREVASRVQV